MNRESFQAKATVWILSALCAGGCGAGRPQAATPAAAAAEVKTASLSDSVRAGLERANWYRTMAGLPPIVHDPAHDDADFKHARYVVKNDINTVDFDADEKGVQSTGMQLAASRENPDNQWYTNEGANAAYWSWTVSGTSIPADLSGMVDVAMASPFSALTILNPQAASMSEGQFCERGRCAITISYEAGLDLDEYLRLYEAGRDIRQFNRALGKLPFTAGRLIRPLQFPPPNSTMPRLVFSRPEWPDIQQTCRGYKFPLGQPIILEPGQGATPMDPVHPSSYSVFDGDREIQACLVDATTFHGADELQTNWGRNMLFRLGAVVLVPSEPLAYGHTYKVAMKVDGTDYAWSFAIAPEERVACAPDVPLFATAAR